MDQNILNQNISKKEMLDELVKKEESIYRLTQELEDVKNFMESIIQSIGSGIIITGIHDTVTYINKAGERILGYSKDELIGKSFGIFGLREKQSIVHSLLNNPDDLDTRKEGWMRRKIKWSFPLDLPSIII
jgi:nitrogen fixation/metabolism regulation signal transduction histidine kinase